MTRENLDLFACDQCSSIFHVEEYEKDAKDFILEGIIV